MKKAICIVLGLALAGTTGCVDLTEKLVGTVTTQYFSSGAGLDAAVMGDYALQRGFWGREQALVTTEFGTDLTTFGDQPNYKYIGTYAGGLSAAEPFFRYPWNTFYQAINSSNAVIDRAAGVTDMADATKAARVGEAKFLRALDYFYLVQMYGPAPLPVHEAQGASTAAHRSPVDSIYLQIVQDLRDAIAVLPATQNNEGRATKGAAQALLAKVLLTRAYHPYPYEQSSGVVQFLTSPPAFLREAGATSATDFAQAQAEADSVINSGNYSLLTNFVDNFCSPMGDRGPGSYCNLPTNENNSELIWSVQFSEVPGQYTVGSGNTDFVFWLSFYDDRQGMTRDCNNGRAFRRGRPTMYGRQLWQRWTDSTHSTVLDTRYDGTFQSVWYANATLTGPCYAGQSASRLNHYTTSAGNCSFLPDFGGTGCTLNDGGAFAIGDTAMYQPGYIVNGLASCSASGCSQAFRQSKEYAVVEPCLNASLQQAEPCPVQTTVGQYDWFRYPTIKKLQDQARSVGFNDQDGGRDVPILRLGEVYLIAAEAACAASYNSATCTGSQATILNYVRPVRERAANCQDTEGCSAATEAANKATIMDASHMPATIDLDWILDERGREMIGEYMRWFDLARTGLWHRIPDDNYEASPAGGGFFNAAKHDLRPIPQSQIDNTAGGISAFPQNPLY